MWFADPPPPTMRWSRTLSWFERLVRTSGVVATAEAATGEGLPLEKIGCPISPRDNAPQSPFDQGTAPVVQYHRAAQGRTTT